MRKLKIRRAKHYRSRELGRRVRRTICSTLDHAAVRTMGQHSRFTQCFRVKLHRYRV